MKSTSKTKVGPSAISGNGLFATTDIKKGEIIKLVEGLLVTNDVVDLPPIAPYFSDNICIQVDYTHHLVPLVLEKDSLDGIFVTNHSCQPNAGIVNTLDLIAMRDIRSGEEITTDYAMTDADFEGQDSIPTSDAICNCGSDSCRKVIKGTDWQISDLQHRYKGYFSPFVQKIIDTHS